MSIPPRTQTIALALEYPILQMGGTEVLVRQLIAGLSRAFRMVLVSPDDPASIPTFISEKLAAHIPLDWKRHYSLRGGHELASAMRGHQVDLAHFHLGGTYNWGSRFFHSCPLHGVAASGLPFLITTHGVFDLVGVLGKHRPQFLNYAIMPYVWASRCTLSLRSKKEVMVSSHDEKKMRSWFSLARGKFGQIYHSQLLRPIPKPPQKDNIVLCVGTIGSRKGQWILATAFSKICRRFPDWKLLIVGRPGEEEFVARTKSCAEPCGDQVQFLTDASDDDVAKLYRQAAIFAMPSLQEGLGLSLQEAIFFGCVPIGSRVGGIPELIEHERNGILVPPGDPETLSLGLSHLMTNPRRRAELASSGAELLLEKEMFADLMIEKYTRTYHDILFAETP